MFVVLFFCFIFYVIFGIINLFVYIIFKFLKCIFKCIFGTNKHKEKYDKKILSQAIIKVFLDNVRKKTARNIFSDTDLNTILSTQLYQYIDSKKIITDEIKKCLKDKIFFLFNILYIRDFSLYNFNNFERITNNIIDELDNKNDEILEEYTRIKNNH